MGDAEGSVDDEMIGEEEMKVLLHTTPIQPLPPEILKMQRKETLCRYCGVSYLIFHEFHQLHKQLRKLQAELQELKNNAQNERARKETLEMGRMEWEKDLCLHVGKETETNEKNTTEKPEDIKQQLAQSLEEEFEEKFLSAKKKLEEECQRRCNDKERQLREELDRTTESDAFLKANEDLKEQRRILQQLEERLQATVVLKEEVEKELGKQKLHVKSLRDLSLQQQQLLTETLSILHFCGSGFADVRRSFSRLTWNWQVLRSQILEHISQVFSALTEKLRCSTAELQKTENEKELVTQQLKEQKQQRDEQLSQQENLEKQHKGELLRVKMELEAKHSACLLCQQKCDAIQKQLLSQEQKEEQLKQKCCAAAEEVARLTRDLGKIQEEKRKLTTERDLLTASHNAALGRMREEYEQQLDTKLAAALEVHRSQKVQQITEVREELHKTAQLTLDKERERNQMLLQKCQQENSVLKQELEERQLEVQDLQEELQQEKRRQKEERTHDEERNRRKEEAHQKEAQELSQTKAELRLTVEKNAELTEEVALLQETVRRECEEREELTAALCQAQQELFGQQSATSHPSSSRVPDVTGRQTSPGHKSFQLQRQTKVPLTRFLIFPNTHSSHSASTEKEQVLRTEKEKAEDAMWCRIRGAGPGGGGRAEITLPRLKARRSMWEFKHKVNLEMRKKL